MPLVYEVKLLELLADTFDPCLTPHFIYIGGGSEDWSFKSSSLYLL